MSLTRQEHILALVLAAISGVCLIVFYFQNKYKRIERWYYYQNKYLYILLELCYYLLFISFVFNARFMVYEIIKLLIRKKFGIRL
jgi:uncharacterized membrane protein HdeD (DUF308 family)